MFSTSSYGSTQQAEIAYRRDRAKASMGRRIGRRWPRSGIPRVAGEQDGATR